MNSPHDEFDSSRRHFLGGAALAASSLRPVLSTMIGFARATSRAAERNALASPMVSM